MSEHRKTNIRQVIVDYLPTISQLSLNYLSRFLPETKNLSPKTLNRYSATLHILTNSARRTDLKVDMSPLFPRFDLLYLFDCHHCITL